MRNRIRKHYNNINAKGAEVNNKFKHSLTTNRPEALSDHARIDFDNNNQDAMRVAAPEFPILTHILNYSRNNGNFISFRISRFS